uniref:CCHC-type domain-containing protein n=1 Tax=Tanacetum cinerariifolium TaxID=118510 RepID=A0A6L2MBU6_TANCI|nr:hypothetical protein [Tanacetum cinerariifolium]
MEAGGKDRPPMLAPGIGNDIYSTVDACLHTCEMWKAIEMLKQDHQVNDQFLLQLQPECRENQDNTLRINRGIEYDNQRAVNVVGARESEGTQVVQQSRIQCYNCKEYRHVAKECQKPKRAKDATYRKEKILLYVADNFGPIFDAEPLQKVQIYNVFPNHREHPEQLEFVDDTYPDEQGDTNISIDSLDMSNKGGEADHDEDEDLDRESDLLASLIEKLKCEIDESKDRNKLLGSSNKTLVNKLKSEIEDFKNKNKCLESSNNHFK